MSAQIILTAIFYLLFTGILVFCILIYIGNVRRTERLQNTLIEVVMRRIDAEEKSAQATYLAAEAAQQAVAQLMILLQSGKPLT